MWLVNDINRQQLAQEARAHLCKLLKLWLVSLQKPERTSSIFEVSQNPSPSIQRYSSQTHDHTLAVRQLLPASLVICLKTAQHITRMELSSMGDLYTQQCRKKANRIIRGPNQLCSRQCHRIRSHTTRIRDSFIPQGTRLWKFCARNLIILSLYSHIIDTWMLLNTFLLYTTVIHSQNT